MNFINYNMYINNVMQNLKTSKYKIIKILQKSMLFNNS